MQTTITGFISEYLERRLVEMEAFLEALVAAESPTLVPDSQKPVQDLLSEVLWELGFLVERIPGEETGGHLYAAPRGLTTEVPAQLLLGHTDTVWPIGALDEMPFAVEDGRIYGPGVFDMKGGLVILIYALRALQAAGAEPGLAPIIFMNSDEEIGSPESTSYIELLARRVERALILEPALGPLGRLKTARKGIGRFTIRILGVPAHAGLAPTSGASAIQELSHLIQTLHGMADNRRGISLNVGLVSGGLRPNVVAPESEAVVDVRVPTTAEGAALEQAIYRLKPHDRRTRYDISGGIERPPLERTARNQALWELAKNRGAELGLKLLQGRAGGASDGNTTSLLTATLDGLGAVGEGAHARNESVLRDRLPERAALLALLLLAPSIPLENGE